MARFLIAVLATSMLVACAPEEYSPVALTDFYRIPADCKFPAADTLSAVQGSLQMASSITPQYQLGFKVVATLGGRKDDISAGGTILETKGLDRPLLDELLVKYEAPGVSIPEYKTGVYMNFPEGYAVMAYFNILSPQAAEVLGGSDGTYELKTSFTFSGRMSRSGAKISTGSVTYPIEVEVTSGCARVGTGYGCVPPGQDAVPACCDGVPSGSGC